MAEQPWRGHESSGARRACISCHDGRDVGFGRRDNAMDWWRVNCVGRAYGRHRGRTMHTCLTCCLGGVMRLLSSPICVSVPRLLYWIYEHYPADITSRWAREDSALTIQCPQRRSLWKRGTLSLYLPHHMRRRLFVLRLLGYWALIMAKNCLSTFWLRDPRDLIAILVETILWRLSHTNFCITELLKGDWLLITSLVL